jgi:hypothetical protein
VKNFPSERNSFLNLSAPVLHFSGDEGKIFTFKPAQKSAGSAIKIEVKFVIPVPSPGTDFRKVGVPPLTKSINYHAKINGFNGLYNGTPADFGQHTSTTTIRCSISL